MKFTLPNGISALRLILIVPFIYSMMNASRDGAGEIYRYAAFALFLIMGVSDFADGYLARTRNQISKLGTFLDPLADKLLILTSCVLLASQKTAIEGFRLPPFVLILIVGKDLLLLMGFVIIYLNIYKVYIAPDFAGKSSTFIQIFMVSAILLGPEISNMLPFWDHIVQLLWWSAGGLAILATFVYIRAGICYIDKIKGAQSNL